MQIKVYYGKVFDHYTTVNEILETFSNKEKAQILANEIVSNGYAIRPIKGTYDFITYKVV
ncbi:hypothetical protein [Paenibacillus cremeus]|uniref:Uncharacterized protein n=1 Tax=Paenibacillus cremeus TaxID=2163881 RepID=A0A559KCS3_9BACL|nr:hypothetical protein [Paenibacillus cremeus]TVY09932.1 hypothetical protein FPZ49_11210 [Paenibacillus cremeus]